MFCYFFYVYFYVYFFFLSHLKKNCTGFPRYLDGDLQLPHRKCDPGCVWGSEEIFGHRASERGMSCSCFGLPFLPPHSLDRHGALTN